MKAKRFLAALLSLVLAGAALAASAAGSNARWNEGSKAADYLNLSVYNKDGECDDGKPADLRIGIKNFKPGTSGSVKSEAMDFCLFFMDDKADVMRCAGGVVDLSYDAKTNEYRGKYDLRLNEADLKKNNVRGDTGVRRGEFRAVYCKPKAPAKK